MIKQLDTKKSLLMALDLRQAHYQALLITYRTDFIVINA